MRIYLRTLDPTRTQCWKSVWYGDGVSERQIDSDSDSAITGPGYASPPLAVWCPGFGMALSGWLRTTFVYNFTTAALHAAVEDIKTQFAVATSFKTVDLPRAKMFMHAYTDNTDEVKLCIHVLYRIPCVVFWHYYYSGKIMGGPRLLSPK